MRKARARALKTVEGGLREVYRMLELPGDNRLKDAHAALDEAVMEAYGFSADEDLLGQLLELNLVVAERIEHGEKVTGPGIPEWYPTPKELVTEDCIGP